MTQLTLGQRIRTARLAAGLTSQAKLAEKCGWDIPSRVGNYEQDTREPSLEDLRLIAKAVEPSGYTYAWLVVGPEAITAATASQPARLDPTIIVSATTALNVFLGRRDDRLDLEDPVDAETFAAACDAIVAIRRDGGGDLEVGAVVSDLLAAREARKNAGRSEQVGGNAGEATGRKIAAK